MAKFAARTGESPQNAAPRPQERPRHGGSYFDIRVIHETWSKGWRVHYWLLPLEATCEEIFRSGFLIERLLEPRPAPQTATIDPEEYQKLAREPRGFMAFRLVPRP